MRTKPDRRQPANDMQTFRFEVTTSRLTPVIICWSLIIKINCRQSMLSESIWLKVGNSTFSNASFHPVDEFEDMDMDQVRASSRRMRSKARDCNLLS